MFRDLLRCLLLVILISCSAEKEEMDVWEREMAKTLQAERIEVYYMNTTTTKDGRLTGAESYLQLDIYDAMVLDRIDHNKRLFTKKCDEIRDLVLKLPAIGEYPGFNEVRLRMIQTNRFLFLSSEKANKVTYRVH